MQRSSDKMQVMLPPLLRCQWGNYWCHPVCQTSNDLPFSANILAKFENSFTRSVVAYELISISNGLDLTSFSKSHEEEIQRSSYTPTRQHVMAATSWSWQHYQVFVHFSDQTMQADFHAKGTWHAKKSLDHPPLMLANHLLSWVQGHFH